MCDIHVNRFIVDSDGIEKKILTSNARSKRIQNIEIRDGKMPILYQFYCQAKKSHTKCLLFFQIINLHKIIKIPFQIFCIMGGRAGVRALAITLFRFSFDTLFRSVLCIYFEFNLYRNEDKHTPNMCDFSYKNFTVDSRKSTRKNK